VDIFHDLCLERVYAPLRLPPFVAGVSGLFKRRNLKTYGASSKFTMKDPLGTASSKGLGRHNDSQNAVLIVPILQCDRFIACAVVFAAKCFDRTGRHSEL